MVEVFKTNVGNGERAEELIARLRVHFPDSRINFDLEDCDRILRIEDRQVCVETIIEFASANGFECEVLN